MDFILCHPCEHFDAQGVASLTRISSLLGEESVTVSTTWMCLICGWIYDEALGDPEHGIAPGTAWADVPMNWTCPECAARKEDFEMVPI